MIEVTTVASPALRKRLGESQVQSIVQTLVRRAEAQPEWCVGKTYKLGATVGNDPLDLALDYRQAGYMAFVALKGELMHERHSPPSDN
jgi:hypothetical protein